MVLLEAVPAAQSTQPWFGTSRVLHGLDQRAQTVALRQGQRHVAGVDRDRGRVRARRRPRARHHQRASTEAVPARSGFGRTIGGQSRVGFVLRLVHFVPSRFGNHRQSSAPSRQISANPCRKSTTPPAEAAGRRRRPHRGLPRPRERPKGRPRAAWSNRGQNAIRARHDGQPCGTRSSVLELLASPRVSAIQFTKLVKMSSGA